VSEFELMLDVVVSNVNLNTPRIYYRGKFY